MLDLKIINGNCFINGKLEKQDIGIKQGKIVNIGSFGEESKETFNAENLTVLPGCIDTQVHFREPGSTDTEDLNSGSKAAVMGGITSVFEMPNTFPATINKEQLDIKLEIAKKNAFCNYSFFIGAAKENITELSKLERLVGCCGVKIFMGSSTGNLLVEDDDSLRKIKIIDLRKKLEQAMTSTDSFGRDARSIMNTLNNIKDPGTVKETVEENSDKIKVFK